MKHIWLLLGVAILVACTTLPPGNSSGSFGPGISGITTVNGTPAYKLSNGEIALLDKPEDTQSYLDRYPPPTQPALQTVKPQGLPASADLSQYQTPVKNQNPRGTCTNFAAVAAIEAQYRRQYGLTLDLSEQWVTHVHHLMELWTNKEGNLYAPSHTENAPGPWDGGSVTFNLQLFSTLELGIPLEAEMPYLNRGDFGDTSKWMPAILDTSPQRLVSDLNLSQQQTTWQIPSAFQTTILPQIALENAKYRANQVLYATNDEEKSLDWFKTQLAGGHEVAFGVRLDSDDPNPKNDVWEIADNPRPDPKTWGGHAMLMVGYDDAKKAFRVKNSWGTGWADSGYVWFSYDFVTKGKVYEAAVVQSVLSPNFGQPPDRLFLGRYNLDHDGQRGVLDIYHIPYILKNSPNWASERRLGTYYGPDNQPRRVNGTINGRQIDFYIDWNNTGARGFGELSGMHYTGYLDAYNQTLSGTMLDNRDGKTYGFYGHKGSYLSGTANGGVSLNAYVGNWQVYGLDIPSGLFSITAVNGSTGAVTGKVFGGGALTGTVNVSDPRLFSFQLNATTYQGYLFGWETGVMAGTAGSGSGFVATRSDFSTPQVSIQSPGSGDTLYRTQSYTLSGQAFGDNGSGFANQPLPCNWASSDAGDNQFPIKGNCTPTIKIRSGSPANVTFTLSATAYGGKSAQTSVAVSVQNPSNSSPPVVSITEPASGSAASVGTTVILKGSWVGGTAPYKNPRWTWQATHKGGCAETDINAVYHPPINLGQDPYWSWDTTGAQNVANGCGFDNGGGAIRLYVTDDLNLTGSASIVFKLTHVPPPN